MILICIFRVFITVSPQPMNLKFVQKTKYIGLDFDIDFCCNIWNTKSKWIRIYLILCTISILVERVERPRNFLQIHVKIMIFVHEMNQIANASYGIQSYYYLCTLFLKNMALINIFCWLTVQYSYPFWVWCRDHWFLAVCWYT